MYIVDQLLLYLIWWILFAFVHDVHAFLFSNNLKDARSVSSYPYNQPQILQNVKYTK